MSALTKKNWKWDQGTDLAIYFVYKTGASVATAVPPTDFSSWSVRMDIKDGSTTVGTINSVSVPEDTHTEATIADNGDIHIILGRELTTTSYMETRLTSQIRLSYDIILRNPTDTIQFKLAEGYIVLDPSVTIWE